MELVGVGASFDRNFFSNMAKWVKRGGSYSEKDMHEAFKYKEDSYLEIATGLYISIDELQSNNFELNFVTAEKPQGAQETNDLFKQS
jgi:hypothetical protein